MQGVPRSGTSRDGFRESSSTLRAAGALPLPHATSGATAGVRASHGRRHQCDAGTSGDRHPSLRRDSAHGRDATDSLHAAADTRAITRRSRVDVAACGRRRPELDRSQAAAAAKPARHRRPHAHTAQGGRRPHPSRIRSLPTMERAFRRRARMQSGGATNAPLPDHGLRPDRAEHPTRISISALGHDPTRLGDQPLRVARAGDSSQQAEIHRSRGIRRRLDDGRQPRLSVFVSRARRVLAEPMGRARRAVRAFRHHQRRP